MENYVTEQQRRSLFRKEFSEVVQKNQKSTITHDQIVEIIRKLGIPYKSKELDELIFDADHDCTDCIELEDYLLVMETLSSKKPANQELLDHPDEMEMGNRQADFIQKLADLCENTTGANISKQAIQQLLADYNVQPNKTPQ